MMNNPYRFGYVPPTKSPKRSTLYDGRPKPRRRKRSVPPVDTQTIAREIRNASIALCADMFEEYVLSVLDKIQKTNETLRRRAVRAEARSWKQKQMSKRQVDEKVQETLATLASENFTVAED